jgi:hypothetical protein
MINLDNGSSMLVTIKTTSHGGGGNNQSTLPSHNGAVAAQSLTGAPTTSTHNNLFNYYNSTIQQSEADSMMNLRFGANKRKSVQYVPHGTSSPLVRRNFSKLSEEKRKRNVVIQAIDVRSRKVAFGGTEEGINGGRDSASSIEKARRSLVIGGGLGDRNADSQLPIKINSIGRSYHAKIA